MSETSKSMSITEVLMGLNEGGTMEDLATELRCCVAAVQSTGKKGKVQLNITIEPNGPTAISTKEEIKATIPKADAVATLFYVTPEAGLTRRDPRQPSLEIAN